MRDKPKVATHYVPSSQSKIEVHVFEPSPSVNNDSREATGTIVTVHPWATLGGGEHNTIGLARHITSQSSPKKQWRVITFTMKSSGAVWGILSKHNYEVQQIVDVTKWAMDKFGSVVLLGSSAGAPMAGSAMWKLMSESRHVDAYVAIGYTFGNFAWLGFGRHFSSLTSSSGTQPICGIDSGGSADQTIMPPKLFVMGERDEFTSVSQLKVMIEKMKSNSNKVDSEIVKDVGHFELESPRYDSVVSDLVIDWLENNII
eukprot:scaffold69200_cov62-Cyclotella_meneghiniana.AAC.2